MKLSRTVYFLLVILGSCKTETKLYQHLHVECSVENISGNQFQEGSQYLFNINVERISIVGKEAMAIG